MKRNFLEDIKEGLRKIQISEITYSIIYLIIAIILIRHPEGVLHTISRVLGVGIIFFSIIRIVYAYRNRTYYNSPVAGIAFNIILILIGICLITIMPIIEITFSAIFGFSIILSGIIKIISAIKIKDYNLIISIIILFIGILFVIGGVYVLGSSTALSIIGYILLAFSIINIIENVFLKYKSII